MKIVAVDNFDRENISDWLVAEKIRSTELANFMCKSLNDKAPMHYVVKPDDYKLYRFEP